MEPYRQNVPEQNNKRHGSHEDGKRHVEVGLNVFGPPGWRSLRKRPRYEEGKRREGGKKEDQSKTRTHDLRIDGMQNGFGQLKSSSSFILASEIGLLLILQGQQIVGFCGIVTLCFDTRHAQWK